MEKEKMKITPSSSDMVSPNRKSTGAFYTPEPLVNWMCQAALLAWLESTELVSKGEHSAIRNALENRVPFPKIPSSTAQKILTGLKALTICDPAVGAGVFLIGMAQEVFRWMEWVSAAGTLQESSNISRKEWAENALWGTDIDEIALHTATAKLAEWVQNETEQTVADLKVRLVHRSFFDFPTLFPEQCKRGFDIVIGNPPYLKEYTSRAAFKDIPYFQGKMDLWYAFAGVSFDLLKPGGTFCFIATANWTTNQGATRLREQVTAQMKVLELIDFGSHKLFPGASVQTMILLMEKRSLTQDYPFRFRKMGSSIPSPSNWKSRLQEPAKAAESVVFKTGNSPDSPFQFHPLELETTLNQIEEKANFYLDGKTEIIQGIVPNPDRVTPRNIEKIPAAVREKRAVKNQQGVFVVPPETLSNLTATEQQFIKPLYEAAGIRPFYLPPNPPKQLIYLTKKNIGASTEKIPNLIAHLNPFREIMEDRRENKRGRLQYFHLHWPRKESFFQAGPKILSVRKCKVPTFVYTEEPAYVMLSFCVIRSERINLQYLTGILNSSLMTFWLRHRGKMQGDQFQVDAEPLCRLPIFVSENEAAQREIIDLVQAIEQQKQEGGEGESQWEELNQSVWDLYGCAEVSH